LGRELLLSKYQKVEETQKVGRFTKKTPIVEHDVVLRGDGSRCSSSKQPLIVRTANPVYSTESEPQQQTTSSTSKFRKIK